MQCPRCHAENREGRRFCGECGLSLSSTCPSCGFLNEGNEKFCGGCGGPLSQSPRSAEAKFASPQSYTPKHLAERILTSRAALEGERKQVTVLFADLKGSMELLADRDPEEARKILDPVLEWMMEAVHRYEGTVNQVMGDGIMALFGAPLAHEDHAVRACYAALRMQESVQKYAEEVRRSHAAVVKIRVGLNSGEVVVRAIGSDLHMDYTAVGQTTHLAARMEQLADPGAIVITPDTLALAEGHVEVKSLGPVPVKGLADAVEVYEVTGAGPARTRLQAGARRGLTRFVGRDAEIGHLRRVLDQAAAGHGQVAAVVGEAGVGKSRLTYEFTHSHRVQNWLILEASSVSYGKATSYLPVIDLLKGYFKIGDRDDHREIRAKILGRALGLDRALEPLLPPLLALLDVPIEDPAWQNLDPPQRRQRTLEAVKRLLLRESQVQPLLVVFEDLHSIDGETQALLDSLVESLGSARLLLLVNYRPEYEHRWGTKTAYSQLRLDSLPAESAAELLAALLGPDPGLAPLTQMLVKRGNPFFLEETVRTLVETGALAGERGAYRLTRPVEALQVPATVQAILAARIDRLPPEEKRLLQAASVIGKDVPMALLLAIADAPEHEVRAELMHLQAAEFLYETRLFPDLEYTFKHALTHEVAYGSLLHDRRRQLHAAIVEAMEHHYAGRLSEQAERLAHHAVRGEAWEKAVTHLWQAGRNARARSAYRQAVAFLEQAVETLTRLPDTAENAALGIDLICRDLSDPLVILDETQRLLKHLREAARLAEKVGDRARLANVLARTLWPLRADGQYARAVEIGERALALAKEVGDARLKALAGMELSSLHDTRLAEALLTEALFALDSLPAGTSDPDSVWLRRRILENLARVMTTTGRYQEAVAHGEEALRMAEDLGHSAPIAWTLGRLGRVYCCRGDVNRAIDLCTRSLALARERGVHNVIQWSSASLGVAYTLDGRTTEAVARLEEAVAAGESTSSLDPYTLVSLGHAYLSAGRSEDASRCAREALVMCRQRTRRDVEADALHLIGDLAARREPASEEAMTHYRQALALADELGMRPLVAHCHLGLGKLYLRTGKREQAQEHLTTATTMYREMDMRFWLEKAEAEVKELQHGS
jgi:class 3 adenylate cyclase/tetratricopeptide (TPR) repeat protein